MLWDNDINYMTATSKHEFWKLKRRGCIMVDCTCMHIWCMCIYICMCMYVWICCMYMYICISLYMYIGWVGEWICTDVYYMWWRVYRDVICVMDAGALLSCSWYNYLTTIVIGMAISCSSLKICRVLFLWYGMQWKIFCRWCDQNICHDCEALILLRGS